MFGLSTLIQMNKRAAAQMKGKMESKLSGFCAEDPVAPKSEATKVKEFNQPTLRFTRSEKTRGTLKALAEARRVLESQKPCAASTPDAEVRPHEDFVATSRGPNGGLLVTPRTDAAKALLRKMFAYSDDYQGAAVVLKHRDWPSLLFTIEAAGMTASRK